MPVEGVFFDLGGTLFSYRNVARTNIPLLIESATRLGVGATEADIKAVAQTLTQAKDVLFLGRGRYFPLALEGALKLKEVSYIHAEGYAAGELKHGPIALIEQDLPIVVVAPYDDLFEKTLSNVEEVRARGGRIILVSDDKGIKLAGNRADHVIRLPDADEIAMPILAAIPMQLLAYFVAVAKGTDVDQPRNLAKSVTVE